MSEKLFPKLGGGGLCWGRRGDITDASPEAWWLMKRSVFAGYIIIVVLASFVGQGETRLYALAFPPEPRGGGGVYSDVGGGGGGGKKVNWCKLLGSVMKRG